MNDRRDEWAHGVDENLASLNASQRVWDQELSQIRAILDEIDDLLRGDTQRETSGIIGRLERLEHEITKANAVLFVDSTGKKGLAHDVDVLMGRIEERKVRWSSLTAIIVAVISSLTLLLTNLDKLKHLLPKDNPDQVSRMIEKAKRKKGKPIIRYRVLKTPPDSTPADEPKALSPE